MIRVSSPLNIRPELLKISLALFALLERPEEIWSYACLPAQSREVLNWACPR